MRRTLQGPEAITSESLAHSQASGAVGIKYFSSGNFDNASSRSNQSMPSIAGYFFLSFFRLLNRARLLWVMGEEFDLVMFASFPPAPLIETEISVVDAVAMMP